MNSTLISVFLYILFLPLLILHSEWPELRFNRYKEYHYKTMDSTVYCLEYLMEHGGGVITVVAEMATNHLVKTLHDTTLNSITLSKKSILNRKCVY
jgi:hypothetical protein